MELTNVFIVFTSAHIFHAQNIISTYSLTNYIFVCTNRALTKEFNDQTKVVTVGDDVKMVKDSNNVYYDRHAGFTIEIKDEKFTVIKEQDIVIIV